MGEALPSTTLLRAICVAYGEADSYERVTGDDHGRSSRSLTRRRTKPEPLGHHTLDDVERHLEDMVNVFRRVTAI